MIDMQKTQDETFMRQALALAKKGEGSVEPNPMVGCVIVQNSQIVGQGYHTQYGQAHAEIEAIRSSSLDLTGATCYVNLEPCSHYGKTPPCTDAIIRSGIRRVVIAMTDPNPNVNGKGIALLKQAGIVITEHILESEARRLNAPYLTLHQKNRPWVHAKWAMTLDGKLAAKSYDSQWISGEEARLLVHRLRSRMDGILVGAGTAMRDDPRLTVRLPETLNGAPQSALGRKIPCRVVLDSAGMLPVESRLVQSAREFPVLIVTETQDLPKCRQWEQHGCEILHWSRREGFVHRLLEQFAAKKWTHLLVEGGRHVFGSFFDAQSIDEVHAFIAPKLLGGESAIPVFGGQGLDKMSQSVLLDASAVQCVGQDVYIQGRVDWGRAAEGQNSSPEHQP